MYWGPYYLTHSGFSSQQAGYLSVFFDIGGVLGGISAGYISDKLRSRALVASMFLFMSIWAIWLFYSQTSEHPGDTRVVVVWMCVVGFWVNGPYSMITTAVSADLGDHMEGKALSTVSGIIDGMGSFGAAIQGVVIGLISTSSWAAVFKFLMLSCFLSTLCISGLVKKDVEVLYGRWKGREGGDVE